MTLCYIGLGANLNSPVETIKQAIKALKKIPNSKFVACSNLYVSKPMGPTDQPDYVNAVAAIQTELTPEQLFQFTYGIEQRHGRTRNGEHWGPRTLDLDILLYGNLEIQTDELTIPHYGLKQREFVIYPLLDIDPGLVLPCGTSVESLTSTVPTNGMKTI